MRFPEIEVRSLEGESYLLPDDLPAGPRFILLPFQRWHQIAIERWRPELERISVEYPSFTYWEVPALSRAYASGRFYIDGGMRAGIPDVDVRRHTLTAYTDLRRLAEELGLGGFGTLQVFLLDGSGSIVWRDSGEVDAEKLMSLQSALDAAATG